MPKPRKHQISLDDTPFYHCVSRCVRRAFLCGEDPVSGQSFEHRRERLYQDALRLNSIFFIDCAAIAVMANHYHLVLHVNQSDALKSNPEEIAKRWHRLFGGTELSHRFVKHKPIEDWEREQLDTLIDLWRNRLYSISWFMRVLNEQTARQANKEDDCSGRFWEGRFKCQALLDEQALLSCMAYVDLNPVRAGIANTPETSDYTSVKERVEHWRKISKSTPVQQTYSETFQPKNLLPFVGNPREPMPAGLAFSLIDYLELVDWTGRQVRDDKRGSIATSESPILQRLGISPAHWVYLCTHFESRFKGLVGTVHSMKHHCANFGFTTVRNRTASTIFS